MQELLCLLTIFLLSLDEDEDSDESSEEESSLESDEDESGSEDEVFDDSICPTSKLVKTMCSLWSVTMDWQSQEGSFSGFSIVS